jgi:hypothetical protein
MELASMEDYTWMVFDSGMLRTKFIYNSSLAVAYAQNKIKIAHRQHFN